MLNRYRRQLLGAGSAGILPAQPGHEVPRHITTSPCQPLRSFTTSGRWERRHLAGIAGARSAQAIVQVVQRRFEESGFSSKRSASHNLRHRFERAERREIDEIVVVEARGQWPADAATAVFSSGHWPYGAAIAVSGTGQRPSGVPAPALSPGQRPSGAPTLVAVGGQWPFVVADAPAACHGRKERNS